MFGHQNSKLGLGSLVVCYY